jgi:hypothetical protein
VTEDEVKTAIVNAVRGVVGPNELLEEDVTIQAIRAGSIVVDFAINPRPRFQDSVQCALRRSREDGSLVRELKRILTARQSAAQPSEATDASDSFTTCSACTAQSDVECTQVLQAYPTPVPPPGPTVAPAKSGGSGGASVGLIAGIAVAAVAVVVAAMVLLQRRKQTPKTVVSSSARHTVAFENPICTFGGWRGWAMPMCRAGRLGPLLISKRC